MPKRGSHTFKEGHTYKAAKRYNTDRREGESMQAYYRRLAKAADQRMVRLEELAKQKEFKNVKRYAYATALEDIKSFGGGGQGKTKNKRWNTKPPEDERKLYEKIKAMKYFLESPTSTKAGIVEVYQKKAKTLNENYGTNFTWQDLADYYGKGQADIANREAGGSGTALLAIGVIQDTQKKLVSNIKNNMNIKVSPRTLDAAIDLLSQRKQITGIPKSAAERKALIQQLERLKTT